VKEMIPGVMVEASAQAYLEIKKELPFSFPPSSASGYNSGAKRFTW
jgi:hypothetical protein